MYTPSSIVPSSSMTTFGTTPMIVYQDLVFVEIEPDALADRRLVREHRPRHELVDHGDRTCVEAVAAVEQPALRGGDAERLEVRGAYGQVD